MRMLWKLKERDPEQGFTLVEVAVALGVMFVTLLALAQTAVVGFRDVAFGRQRQTANQIANQIIEEVRGLPYDTVTKGLADADLTGDPNIVSCTGGYYFRVCPPNPDAEPIVHTPGLANVSPLVPHRGSFGAPDYNNTYNWSVYVTAAVDAPAAGAFRIWAIVEWTQSQGGPGLRDSVETQTLIFAPTGCQDTATHPFGAPCQAFHQGTAAMNGGGVSTTGTAETAVFDAFTIDLIQAQSTVQQEQIAIVDGSLTLPGARRIVTGTTSELGRQTGTTHADTDPSTPAGPYHNVSLGPQASGSLTAGGTGTQVSVANGGSDTGSSTSTTAAGGANPCTVQNDEQNCAYTSGKYLGSLTHTVRVPEDGGTATVVSVGTTGTSNVAYARRQVSPPGSDGLVRTRVERVLPEIRIGGLPTRASPPPNWAGYWVRLVNYTATLQAEAGLGTTAPSLSLGGQVEYWNGSGYTTVNVTQSGATFTPVPISVPVNGPNFGAGSVSLSGTFEIKPSSTSQTTGSPATTRTEAEVIAGPPLFFEATYQVTRGANTVVDLLLQGNFGRSLATATYTPAPTP